MKSNLILVGAIIAGVIIGYNVRKKMTAPAATTASGTVSTADLTDAQKASIAATETK